MLRPVLLLPWQSCWRTLASQKPPHPARAWCAAADGGAQAGLRGPGFLTAGCALWTV